jgi:hypothetical protein
VVLPLRDVLALVVPWHAAANMLLQLTSPTVTALFVCLCLQGEVVCLRNALVNKVAETEDALRAATAEFEDTNRSDGLPPPSAQHRTVP